MNLVIAEKPSVALSIAKVIVANQRKDSMVSIKLDANINKELVKYCEKTKHTKTAVIELALEKYLKTKSKHA